MVRPFSIQTYSPSDTWLKAGLSAFVSLFIVTFNNVALKLLLQRSTYYGDLLITFMVAFLLMEFIQWVTTLLDHRMGWPAQIKRLLLQATLGTGAGSLLIYLISYLEYRLIDPEHVFGTESFMKTEFPVAVLFTLIINGLYAGISFYRHWQYRLANAENQVFQTTDNNIRTASIICVNGQRNMAVPTETIALISLQHGITWITTFTNQKYRHPETLSELMSLLPEDTFFRANRQHIVHISACQSYSSIENGKIELILNNPSPTHLIISQKTAATFRKWIDKRQ